MSRDSKYVDRSLKAMILSWINMFRSGLQGMHIASMASSEAVRQLRLSLRLRRWSFLAKAPALHLRPCAPGPCKAGASDRQHIAWGLRDSSSFLLGKSGLSEDLDSSVLIALAQSETAANFPAFGGRSSQPACMPSRCPFRRKRHGCCTPGCASLGSQCRVCGSSSGAISALASPQRKTT